MMVSAGVSSFFLRRLAAPHGPVALMYHSVRPGKHLPSWPWAVSMSNFRKHLDLLADEGYVTPTVNEVINGKEVLPARTALITFDDGYVDNLDACAELQQRGMRATWFIVTGSIGEKPNWPDDGRPGDRLLTPDELRQMHMAGMEIGSHSVGHVRLTEIDATQLRHEVTDSKAALEDILGDAVLSFAYPYGAWDLGCIEAVKKAGYAAACTTRTGWAFRDNDPYALRRLTVFNTDTTSSLLRKLYFARHDVDWWRLASSALRHRTKR